MKILLATVVSVFLVEDIVSNSTQSTWCAEVGNKMFCAYNTIYRTWPEAVEYCKARGTGWSLATITPVEHAFLLTKYDATDFNGDYWIFGRDIQTRAQFAWGNDATPGIINPAIDLKEQSVKVAYQTCLVFASLQSGSGIMFWPCANQLAVLCHKT